MTIASVLVVGLASAVRISTLSLEGPSSEASKIVAAGEAVDRLSAELRLAQSFSERTPTAVTFTVPDQTNDGFPETVRYAWDGTGSPLTRTMNGASVPLLEDVRSLNFFFLTRTLNPPIQQTQQSAEQQLVAYNNTSTTIRISPSLWAGEYFSPTLPPDTVSWKINRLRLYLKISKRVTTNETLQIAISKAGTNRLPMGSPLETKLLPLKLLTTTVAAVDVPFSTLSGLTPNQGYVFQVQSLTRPSQTISLATKTNISPALVNMAYFTSTTQGATWTAPSTVASVKFQIYGTITKPVIP
jgi:hypothetical protein